MLVALTIPQEGVASLLAFNTNDGCEQAVLAGCVVSGGI